MGENRDQRMGKRQGGGSKLPNRWLDVVRARTQSGLIEIEIEPIIDDADA